MNIILIGGVCYKSHLQYFGELLLLCHRMESVDLDWKLKTFFLIFAPCTQLTFLGAYIYFWMSEKSEKKEVRIVLGIVNMLSFCLTVY